MTAGCSSTGEFVTAPTPDYQNALEETSGVTLNPGSPEEQAALERLKTMFNEYTPDQLRKNIPEVYAEEFFFRDGFKTKTRREELVDYMAESTESITSCQFDFAEPIIQDGNYYLRWTMHLDFKKSSKKAASSVLGMSHIRFNKDGKVVFHQDYWDPSDIIYKRIPVMGWIVRQIRKRI